MTLQRSARQIVEHWCEYRTPHPDWPPDLPYALASEVLILREALEEIVRREGFNFTSWDMAAFAREALK